MGEPMKLRTITPQGLALLRYLEAHPRAGWSEIKKAVGTGGHIHPWVSYYRKVVVPLGGLESWLKTRGIP